MNIKPKEVLINVPVALMLDSEDEAAKFASNINTIIHGKVKIKYDYLGRLGSQEAIIFYLQRNDEYHSIRDEFMRLIEQEEIAKVEPYIEDPVEETDISENNNDFFLSKAQLSKLTTPRLLAYKKSLYVYPEGPDWGGDTQMNKSRPEWQEVYKNVKEILSTREHIEK